MPKCLICPKCGAELPPGSPRKLCPRCLLHAGLGSEGLTASSKSVLETIGGTMGSVPRILLRDTDGGLEPPLIRPGGEENARLASRYRIDGEIARGGMGSVLRGRDPDLGRDVAIKVLREDFGDNPDMVRRFVEEAQIGGQLQHPGIVPIYELGTFGDRRPFFSMKLVKGHTLAALLDDRKSPTEERARFLGIFEQVAQTVAYAHARGVIHRDLKPSNVMVGAFGEVQVMDWGLAKVLPRGGQVDDAQAGKTRHAQTVIATARSGSDDTDLSRAGSVMGTPAYMAPEQARGGVDLVDERADVFALGSILCEVLTGDAAFTGRSGGEIQRKAALGDLADALGRLERCGSDAELVAIARECLSREREDRPRDASDVTERVTAYLAGVQERLVTTEVARGAEAARAEEAQHTARAALARAAAERKARRFQAGLAASILALTTIGGLSFMYWIQQRQAASARAERLLSEATLLRDQAKAESDDVARWEKARDALVRAESDLADRTDATVRVAMRALQRDIQTGLDAAVGDRKLMETLVDIRSARVDDQEGSATDAAYVDAFRSAGIDPDVLAPAVASARLSAKPKPVARAMIAALDHWTAVRLQRDVNGEGGPRLIAVARAADPDPDRDALRSAFLIKDRAARLERLRPLAERANAESWAPASLVSLGVALADAGAVDAAVTVLTKASSTYPMDARVNYHLGNMLERLHPPRHEEAIRAYSVARALHPELGSHQLAHALYEHDQGEEAESVFRDLIRRRPNDARHLSCFGVLLHARGRFEEATAVLDRAIAAGRDLIRRKPDFAPAHHQLGQALRARGRPAEAVVEYSEALRLEPDHDETHNNLGVALYDQEKTEEAIAEWREAIRLKPESALPHNNLGVALCSQGKLDEGIAELRTAIRLNPDLETPSIKLAEALTAQGKPDEAVAAYREAIRLKPDHAEAHCNLGLLLRMTGNYADALAELRRGHELGSKRSDWRNPSAEWVNEVEHDLALAPHLPAILEGAEKPRNAADALSFARLCRDRGLHAIASRLLAEAFSSYPELCVDRRTQNRFNAACSAALAGSGRSKDQPAPDAAARAKLRRQALEWLKAELAAWSKIVDSGDARTRTFVFNTLAHWSLDGDLSGIRNAEALAQLPESEQAEFRVLWADVEALKKRARVKTR